MFRIVLNVEFKTPIPSEVLEAIHRIRSNLVRSSRCVCSDVPPLLCLCSNVIVKLTFSIESPGGIRALTTQQAFTCVIEGNDPIELFKVLEDLVRILRSEDVRIKLVA